MIIDKIANLHKYVALNPLFSDVEAFLQTHNLMQLAEGQHLIKGNDLFVNIEVCKGKQKDEAVIEFHREMIDIQIPLSSDEIFGYSPVEDLPEVDFDVERDIAKVPGVMPQNYVKVKRGQFIVFFPQDGHAPCIANGKSFKKTIFKVKNNCI